MTAGEEARVRKALDGAQAEVGWPPADTTAAGRQRHYARQHLANAAALDAAGLADLAQAYRATAREYEAADRIEASA